MRRIVIAAAVAALVCAGGLSSQAEDLAALLAPNATAQKVVGDCKFTEGPAYSPKGFLVFSDIPNNRIVRVDADGSSSDFMKPSGQANGLMFDAAGHLYACQGGGRQVVKINSVDGKLEVLANSFEGKKLNSPNDLALDPYGGLYFTDPRYGKIDDVEQPVMGVYYISTDGKVSRVIDDLQRPNGILVTADGKSLIVAEPNRRQIWQYPLSAPGKLGAGKVIFTGDEQLDGGGPDGMALDADGRIYATYKGVVVIDAGGKLIGRIAIPEQPANCKFGGPDGKTLYVTARTSLYKVAMNVAGAPLMARGPRPAAAVSQTDSRLPVRLVADEKVKTRKATIEDITLEVPTSWQQQEPSNTLRLAQFSVPATEGDKDPAEIVISFFQGDGGGVDANLKRWVDQFEAKGREAKTAKGESAQGAYVLSEVSGTYLKSIGPPIAGKKQPMAGYRSLNLILTVKEKGNYFVRLIGPDKTVKAAAESFRKSFGGDASKEVAYESK